MGSFESDDEEDDLTVQLNFLSLEAESSLRNDYELIDDYTCLDNKEIDL